MILRLVERRHAAAAQAGPALGDEAWLEALREAAAGLGLPAWTVEVVLVEDEAMAALNAGYRGQPDVTDVLSFTYLETAGRGPAALPAGRGGAGRDLWPAGEADEPQEDGPVVGEVIIAPGFVTGRCRQEGWSAAAELALLVVHGCLHVLGWEHDDPQARSAMQDREAELLGLAGFEHPLRGRS